LAVPVAAAAAVAVAAVGRVVSPQEKIEAIAVGTYGAAGVSYSPEAEEAIQVCASAREGRGACACACACRL
jgi:formyltetrahydrofolate synthetase